MSEVEELREQVETLQRQFASYVEAQQATADIEEILAAAQGERSHTLDESR